MAADTGGGWHRCPGSADPTRERACRALRNSCGGINSSAGMRNCGGVAGTRGLPIKSHVFYALAAGVLLAGLEREIGLWKCC
jgi:hypothetical protein